MDRLPPMPPSVDPSPRPPTNSLTAAAVLLDAPNLQRLPSLAAWGNEAWHYFDTVPEVRFATTYLSNALSRCRLVAARMGKPGDEPEILETGAAADLMAEFGGGSGGQSQILAAAAPQLTVPGVGYIVGEPPQGVAPREGETDPNTWRVLSADEIKLENGQYVVKEGEGLSDNRTLPSGSLAVRFWRPHHRWHWQPDSPIRSCLPVLRELELLSQHIDATAVSRLAGAGLLLIASEVTCPVDPKYADEPDPFTASLLDTMTTAIRDRDSAAAVCPVVVRVPGEYIDKIRHMAFSTPLDGAAQELRTEALRRFAAGIDLPAEVILGMAASNHWTAWQIEESALKLHIEPALEAICHGVGVGYLTPALRVAGEYDPDVVVWYDASELTVRPDRSGDAKDLYDRRLIGAVATRRETGFSDTDAPTAEELRTAVLLDVVSAAPSLFPMVAPMLGLTVEIAADAEPLPTTGTGDTPQAPAEAPGPPALPDTAGAPGNAVTAAANDPTIAALLGASDGLVVRALEVAGRRLETAAKRAGFTPGCANPTLMHTCTPEGLRTETLDSLLAGAWERVPEVAARYGVDPTSLRVALDTYTRDLVASGWPHEYDALAGVLGAG